MPRQAVVNPDAAFLLRGGKTPPSRLFHATKGFPFCRAKYARYPLSIPDTPQDAHSPPRTAYPPLDLGERKPLKTHIRAHHADNYSSCGDTKPSRRTCTHIVHATRLSGLKRHKKTHTHAHCAHSPQKHMQHAHIPAKHRATPQINPMAEIKKGQPKPYLLAI